MKKVFIYFGLLLLFIVLLISVSIINISKTPLTKSIPVSSPSSKTGIENIAVIVMENKSRGEILNNPEAPYINSLIKKYSFAANYYAVTHPSLPNYLAILGGDTFGVSSDCSSCFISAKNMTDQLDASHKTWKAYMESMPSPCFIGSTNIYAQKHNPFIYFDDIRNNPKRCKNIVPLSFLGNDLQSANTTPDFIWITPNICNDMHSCPVSAGDSWLSKEIPLLLNSPAFKNNGSFIVITWDEGTGNSNRVATILVGNAIKNGYSSDTLYNHYSLLKTIEKVWRINPLSFNVTNVKSMQEFFKD